MERLQVLIIDDDKETAALFSTVLDVVGFECEISSSARDALGRLAASVPDLVLLDLRLGLELGGEDILYQIRSNPRFDATRVIVITAYPNIAEVIADLSDLILIKPVEVEQLRRLAERLASFTIQPKRIPFRDPVTQLFNRDFFYTRLELAYERSKRRPEFLFGVLAIQLQLRDQQEEQINPDAPAGILRAAAERLRHILRPTDTIARLAGWKFATIHEELRRPEDVNVILERIRGKLSEPYAVLQEVYQMKVCFGSAVNAPDYRGPGEILEAAEAALEEALRSG